MRTYGRVYDEYGNSTWTLVETDPNGHNDLVYATALVQTLKLNINESPFYASSGIPAKPSVVQQIFPDYYVAMTQQQYAPHFADLSVARVPNKNGDPKPVYSVAATTKSGTTLAFEIPQ